MSARQPPGTPPTPRLSGVLHGSGPLARLLQRARESSARLAAVAPRLPPGLREQVRAGPLDDDGWQLLVANGALAAKLRQCLPELQQALADAGFAPVALKVKVQVPGR